MQAVPRHQRVSAALPRLRVAVLLTFKQSKKLGGHVRKGEKGLSCGVPRISTRRLITQEKSIYIHLSISHILAGSFATSTIHYQLLITSRHMNEQQVKDPLHGVTLEQIMNFLVADYGWDKLGKYIKIRCFTDTPSVQSSLKFLRKTPWAREKVEKLYIATQKRAQKRK